MYTNHDELYHFGVLGMKWGKHKAKTSNSSNPTKTSKHYDSLVSKYSQKGYSSEEASRRAKNRIKTEKALAIAGGTALAAAGAYLTYKKYVKDTVLSGDTVFERYGHVNSGQKLKDSFVYTKKDKFGGKYGDSKITKMWRDNFDLRGNNPKPAIYTSKFKEGTKVASPKHARDAFVKRFKDDKYFREDIADAIADMKKNGKIKTKEQYEAVKSLNKAINGDKKFLRGKVYDGFTKVIKDDNKHSQSVNSSYFHELGKKGINAVVDRDTKKLSSIRAKNPIIRKKRLDGSTLL